MDSNSKPMIKMKKKAKERKTGGNNINDERVFPFSNRLFIDVSCSLVAKYRLFSDQMKHHY